MLRTLGYFGNNAFVLVDGAGTKRPGRYQILPVAGIHTLKPTAATKLSPNYLFDDLDRLAQRSQAGAARHDQSHHPIFITDGIQLSDDPFVPLRSAVYALSVQHRQ